MAQFIHKALTVGTICRALFSGGGGEKSGGALHRFADRVSAVVPAACGGEQRRFGKRGWAL